MENHSAQFVVKSGGGKSDPMNIKNFIMQGGVMGRLFCTNSMDKLGKIIYEDDKLLYAHKGTKVPCLQMVDDIITITECDASAVRMNSVVNTFVETQKLKLSEKKCSVLHVGKKCGKCPKFKVHGNKMHKADHIKYLGDTGHESGKASYNIIERRSKGYAAFAEIRAILEDVPLGKYRIQIGLQLRQAIFINGVLVNSEVWHGVKPTDLEILIKIDHQILQYICGSHAKTPVEFLYMETGTLPIPFIVSCRRMIYLQVILKRDENELLKRVYMAQKHNPT